MFSLADCYILLNNFLCLSDFDNIINNISQRQEQIVLLAVEGCILLTATVSRTLVLHRQSRYVNPDPQGHPAKQVL